VIAVATLRDEAAVQLACEALDAAGIDVEIKSFGGNPYFGSPTRVEWEVRVPEDRESDARAVLDRLSDDVEQAVFAEAGVPAAEEEPAEPPREQPRKVSWAIAIAVILFPGFGCIYARAFSTGILILTISGVLFLASAAGAYHARFDWFVAAKLIDVVLAPLFVLRYNRRLKHAPRS
jgi:hypothetical protein